MKLRTCILAALTLSACYGDVCVEFFDGKCPSEGGAAGTAGTGGGGSNPGGGGDGGIGGSGGNAGGGGEGGVGGGPNPECNPVEGMPIGPECGVFVKSESNGVGSQGNPYGDIATAITNIGDLSNIYVCGDADYVGSLSLPPGIRLIGGVDCENWIYRAANPRASVVGGANSVALTLAGSGDTVVHSMQVRSPDANVSGASSIAVLASERTLELVNVVVVAGAGFGGAAAPDKEQVNDATGPNGNPGLNAPTCGNGGNVSGGNAITNECSGDPSLGGQGGTSTPSQGANGFDGQTGMFGAGGVGQGAVPWSCALGMGGGGDNGSPGSPGSPGSGKGELSASGFISASGGSGAAGLSGQGGGGGGASKGSMDCNNSSPGTPMQSGAGGGGGAGGGCGGTGADGGQGGGSSFGLVLLNAPATLTNTSIQSGAGGAGGAGGLGQPGAAGGTGAIGGTGGGPISNGCRGGDGGQGGQGGGGGGGRGGHSAAIVFEGSEPTLDVASESNAGTAGMGGTGQGNGQSFGNNGLPGTACELMNFGGSSEACVN